MTNIIELIKNVFHSIELIIGSFPFLLVATSIAFCLKTAILLVLISKGIKSDKIQKSWVLIILILIGSMLSDFAWIVTLSRNLFFPNMPYQLKLFITRVAWAFYIIHYQSLALLIENLSDNQNKINIHQRIFIAISSIFSFFFLILAFYDFNRLAPATRPPIELKMMTLSSLYLPFALLLTSLFVTIWKMRTRKIPRILKRQIKIFIQFVVCPFFIADFIQVYPGFLITKLANFYAVIGISTLLITYGIFHCMRKIMGLRFLNLENHVQSSKKFYFINDFKNILDQFSQITNKKELGHITQNFFKEAFKIPARRTRLYLRDTQNTKEREDESLLNQEKEIVETFIDAYGNSTEPGKFLKEKKVLITDEIEFSNFYENKETRSIILNFMNNMAADIFIPIFEKGTLSAYIIVEKYARINHENKNAPFYTNVERDQMLVFANYMANIIKLLQTKNLPSLIQQEKELREELYSKHQEINQYKESLRSFLRNTQQKKIGIMFYKNRKFTFGNQAAHEFVQVNLNTHDGHPTTKAIKRAATRVLEYKTPQTCFINDHKGEKLVVSALPNNEQNNVIMLVYYPEISDIMKKKTELLKDPTKWDYLLYLETTKSGKLINQLIPGNGETLLNFKIDLMKIALSKKAILLDMSDQDLIPTVEILHHISLRENLHILDLQKPSNNLDTAIKLFGINPIFGMTTNNEKPLLEKLDNAGTLFIKNIHCLELETQKHLAEFIKYGFFRKFKGDQKTFANVRIICSTNNNLKALVQDGTFSQELFNELSSTSISMPSLLTLPEDELETLTTGFSDQAIKTDEFQHILELTDVEKKRLSNSRPTSFAELKTKVQQLLIKKSKNNAIYEEAQFDPAYDVSDPELVEAARLGKKALKDKKIMTMLWYKFKNQNKIANLLGVNRSSVNRRCKEYNLIPK